jgi:hypothetical protein
MVSPFEQGVSRGKLERKAIEHALGELKRAHRFFDAEEESFLRVDEERLRLVPGRYVEECKGLAKGSGFGEDEMLAINFGRGVRGLFREGCTAFAVPRSHSDDGSVMLLKNRDLGYRRLHPQVCAYSRLDGFNGFVGVVNGGSVNWYQGVNEKGLIAFNTATRCQSYQEGISIPVLLRRILEECDSLEEALRLIEKSAYSACSNVFLGYGEEAIIVEVKSGFPPHVRRVEKPECRANHYLFHANPEANTREEVLRRLQTLTRYERGKQLLKGIDKVCVDDLQRFSRDHDHGPGSYSICRHAAFVGTSLEKLMSSSTLSAQIFKVGNSIETYVSLGRPCQTEFVRIEYGNEIPAGLATGEVWLVNLMNKQLPSDFPIMIDPI